MLSGQSWATSAQMDITQQDAYKPEKKEERERKLDGGERGGGRRKKKKKHKHADENHQQSRSYDADTQALLNTLSLVALTFEPRPTPIKHFKAFMFPLPQINNIQHPPIMTGANIWSGGGSTRSSCYVYQHGRGNEPRRGDWW